MDGERLRRYWSQEVEAILTTYRQFETLLPNEETAGAAHRGEDGRYIEALIRSYLSAFLPKNLEVLTGFIMRPAVKTGRGGRRRKSEKDRHSGQLDIIVYESGEYPAFQRFDDNVIVPPEGVVAVISVKKHLADGDVEAECRALARAASLCHCLDQDGKPVRGPYLALISAKSHIDKVKTTKQEWIFERIKDAYSTDPAPSFDEVIGYLGALEGWGVFKPRPSERREADLVWIEHGEGEQHLGLQYLLTGVFSVYYDKTRNSRRRPGYTAFDRKHDEKLGSIPVRSLR